MTPGDGPRPAAALVRLQPGGEGPPVYCFHPFGGSAAIYGPLALHIGRDHLVYGLQAVGLAPGHEPDTSVPDMARRYAREIAAACGAGPAPLFLGYSMGGVLALETARLLAAGWPEPPTLVAVDCDPLYTGGAGDGWHVLVRQVLDLDLDPGPLAGLSTTEALARVRAAAAAEGRLPLRFDLDRLGRMLAVCRANERAAAAHVPLPYPGTVHAFRPAAVAGPAGSDMWDGFAGRVVVCPVPADHRTIMAGPGHPHVAARVRNLLGTGRLPPP